MKLTRDRSDEVENTSDDAIAEALRIQGAAIESLRDEIQQALSAGVTEAIKLAEDGDRVEEEEYDPIRTTIGEPDDRQLKKIIELTGIESSASDWVVAGIHASNSALDRSGRRWGIRALTLLGMDFVGKPLITDHLWNQVESSRGIVISSALCKEDASIVPDDMLSGAGAEEFNKEIIQKEGFHWLYLCVAVPRDSTGAKLLETRAYQSVSTGSILFDPYLRCPNCERTSNGKEVRMDTYTIDPKTKQVTYDCPHLAGSPFLRSLIGSAEYDAMNFSDYVILDCSGTSAVEISACQAGCLPRAQFLRNQSM
jgi:hypothetical protein